MTTHTGGLPRPKAHNPWKKPMYLIIWGMIITNISYEFTSLEHMPLLLGFVLEYAPAVIGSLLIYQGCHILRNRHPGFRNAAYIALSSLVVGLLMAILLVTPNLPDVLLLISLPLIIAALVLMVLLLLQLRKAVKAEYARRSQIFSPDVFLWLIAYPFLALGLVFLGAAGLYLFGVMIIVIVTIYIWIFYRMFKMVKELGEMAPDLEQTLSKTRQNH